MAKNNSVKKAQRKSISPAMSSLTQAERSAQRKIRKDLVAKSKAKRAKPKAKAKAKTKRKRVSTIGGVANLLRGRGKL